MRTNHFLGEKMLLTVLCKWGGMGGNSPSFEKFPPSFEKSQIWGGSFPPAFWMAKSQIFRLRRAKIERILVTTSNDFRLWRALIFQNFRLRRAYFQGILVTIPKK